MSGSDDGDGRTWAIAAGALVVVALIGGGLVLLGGPPGGDGTPEPTVEPTPGADPGSDAGTPTDAATPGSTLPTATPAALPPGDPLDGERSLGDAAVTIRGEGNDELGFASAVGDVDGDGTPDVLVGAPFHNASGLRSGAVFAFLGPVEPGNLSVANADATLAGESAGDWAGNDVAIADVDGDGVDDVVVGAPNAGDAGRVYVANGGGDFGGTTPLGEADATLEGTVPGSLTGWDVAVGDLTGGDAADVVIGAPRGENAPGRAYLVDGANVGSTALSDATATFVGETAGDEAGWSVGVAAGDGEAVVAVGAPRNDAAGENAGAAYAVAGPFEGEVPLADADRVLRGPTAGARAGWSVVAPGDLDGDGTGEIAVGAIGAGSGGAAYLADVTGGTASLADATVFRGAAGDQAGRTVDVGPDVTCDGRPELLVGAPRNDAGGANAGAVYVVSDTGGGDLAGATATLVGAEAGDQVGRANGFAAVAGNGTTGLVVGAPFGDAPPTAHVVYADCPA